jgi:hypothetical protein
VTPVPTAIQVPLSEEEDVLSRDTDTGFDPDADADPPPPERPLKIRLPPVSLCPYVNDSLLAIPKANAWHDEDEFDDRSVVYISAHSRQVNKTRRRAAEERADGDRAQRERPLGEKFLIVEKGRPEVFVCEKLKRRVGWVFDPIINPFPGPMPRPIPRLPPPPPPPMFSGESPSFLAGLKSPPQFAFAVLVFAFLVSVQAAFMRFAEGDIERVYIDQRDPDRVL